MSHSSSAVRFAAVQKRFGDGPLVLDQLSFESREGDFIGLIGPSGCGKSTILRMIAGLSPPSGGEILVEGRSPEQASGDIAYVFQEPTLLPWATVWTNVQLPLRLRTVPHAERDQITTTALRLVGIDERRGAYPRELSGGQKMRVSLARALVLSPKILLLDEPFGALDEMARDHLNEELLAIRQRKAWTAFFVTHSVAEAVFLSNRIFILGGGAGRPLREIRVPFTYPRTRDTRESSEYLHLVAEVSRSLRAVEQET